MSEVTFSSEGQTINAYLNDRNSAKGILLFHDIFGYRLPQMRKIADDLAAAGYTVLLPDLYRGNPWHPDNDWANLQAWRQSHSSFRVQTDIRNANQYLRSKVEKVASIGFCWGGWAAYQFAQTEQCDAAILVYGTGMNPQEASAVKSPTLAIFGGRDPIIPMAQANLFGEALVNASPNNRLRVFPGAGHAFVHRPPLGEEETAQQALHEILQWLSENF